MVGFTGSSWVGLCIKRELCRHLVLSLGISQPWEGSLHPASKERSKHHKPENKNHVSYTGTVWWAGGSQSLRSGSLEEGGSRPLAMGPPDNLGVFQDLGLDLEWPLGAVAGAVPMAHPLSI